MVSASSKKSNIKIKTGLPCIISYVDQKISNDYIETIAVYVHLGPEIPQHLVLNIERHKGLFPSQNIVLISSENWERKLPNEVENFVIPIEELDNDLFNEMSKHLDFTFRKGFWQFTIQRLFVLEKLHLQYPSRSMLHIESDVILMPNFPWKKFENLPYLAWLPVNAESDIAALVFSPKLKRTAELVEYLVRFASLNPNTNDMLALRHFAVMNPDKHRYLPSTTNQTLRKDQTNPLPEGLSISNFGGVFDPLAFGMWNFGQDPKNFFGIRRRYFLDKSHFLDPSKTSLSYTKSELVDSDNIRVFNLHLHSKNLKLFCNNWEASLNNGLREAKSEKNKYNFNPKIFISLMKENGSKSTLWELLANFPGLKRLETHSIGILLKKKIKKIMKL